MFNFIILTISAIALIYLYLKRCFLYWKRRGVAYVKPQSLIFGNAKEFILGQISFAESVLRNYNALAPYKFGGIFRYNYPVLYIRDPELIKHVLIKDSYHFFDRSNSSQIEKLSLTTVLVTLAGDRWNGLRKQLTATFTSGKLKVLFLNMRDYAKNMTAVLEECTDTGKAIDIKALMGRYMTDVITCCAFGLESNTLTDPTSPYRSIGRGMFAPTLQFKTKILILSFLPKLSNLLGIKMRSSDISPFFTKLVHEAAKYRRQNNIHRGDFLGVLISICDEAKKNNPQDTEYNLDLISAHCLLFFVAGSESSSRALSLALYELACRDDVQKRVQNEIDLTVASYGGELTYEALNNLPYVDRVLNEVMRLYPNTAALFRTCTRDYPVPNSNFVIKKGLSIRIPLQGLHRDPQYFVNPNIFDPDTNFSNEANASRPNFCFLPFGEGPRSCIGKRFGKLLIKLALAAVLIEYSVAIHPDMKYSEHHMMPHTIFTVPVNEIFLKVTKREK